MAFSIVCTGDACVGDRVKFKRAIFTGSWRKPKFSHNEVITAEIISDSYGLEKQQHTFTLMPIGPRGGKIKGAKPFRIMGRNLYRNGLLRMPWADEDSRLEALKEKHMRGEHAREARSMRHKYGF